MDFLFGPSPVQKTINKATSKLLITADWGANMEIIDKINRAKDGGKEYLKAIRKRIGHKDYNVVRLALELLGACVKNCGFNFHQHVHRQECINDVVKVHVRKGLPGDVRDRALTLIMEWAEAFAKEKQFPNFWQTYQKLRQRGVDFPARDMNKMAPVFTPAAKPGAAPVGGAGPEQKASEHPYATLNNDYVAKIRKELRQCVNYCTLATDVLKANGDNPSVVKSDDTLQSLVPVLKEMQSRVFAILAEIEHEQLIDLLIQVNDHIAIALNWYKAACKGDQFKVPKMSIPEALLDEDLPDDKETPGNPAATASTSPEQQEAVPDADDDDKPKDVVQPNNVQPIIDIDLNKDDNDDADANADDADDPFNALANERHGDEDENADEFDAIANRDEAADEQKDAKTAEQELEDLLGLVGPADPNIQIQDDELEDLLALTGAAPAGGQDDSQPGS